MIAPLADPTAGGCLADGGPAPRARQAQAGPFPPVVISRQKASPNKPGKAAFSRRWKADPRTSLDPVLRSAVAARTPLP